MIWRILIVAVLIAAAGFGYVFVRDKLEADRRAEYHEFAAVVAETSFAAELYRNTPDSFLIVRDSILKKHAVSLEEIETFRAKINKDQKKWAEIWLIVDSVTDSLVKLHNDRLAREHDTAADTGAIH